MIGVASCSSLALYMRVPNCFWSSPCWKLYALSFMFSCCFTLVWSWFILTALYVIVAPAATKRAIKIRYDRRSFCFIFNFFVHSMFYSYEYYIAIYNINLLINISNKLPNCSAVQQKCRSRLFVNCRHVLHLNICLVRATTFIS